MTMLSEHFSLEEMIHSQTASRLGIDNVPSDEIIESLRRVAAFMEKVRDSLLCPVIVSSGYRSPELNKAIAGSSKTSYHMLGLAVDFTVPQFGTPLVVAKQIIQSSFLLQDIDQIIYEWNDWVHIGLPKIGEQPRHQILTVSHGTDGIYMGGIFEA